MTTVAIIGSGYGGAVAASVLTARGQAVDLIEMGQDWTSSALVGKHPTMSSPTQYAMWLKTSTDLPYTYMWNIPINSSVTKYTGLLDVRSFSGIKVYQGKGLGGGSLANGGMAVTPKQAFFEEVMPEVPSSTMYSTYFPRANSALGVNEPPIDIVGESTWYQFTRVVAKQSIDLGYSIARVPNVYDWDYMRQEVHKRVTRSALNQEVIYGNNYGKKDLTKTLLKTALATGLVTLTTLTEVTNIARDDTTGTYTLTLKTIDTAGNTVSTTTKEYDRVILGAGSVGSSELLMKAQSSGSISGLASNTELGKYWGTNGNIMVARNLGISTSTATGLYQSCIPAAGIDAWDTYGVFAEVAPLPVGLETYTANYLCVTNNPNTGNFSVDSSGELALDWDSTTAQPSVDQAKAFITELNTTYGTSVRADLFPSTVPDGAYANHFTYHPLGGAVIGRATELTGELKGAEGLFVLDGSLIPAKIGVNPFVTITALAMYALDNAIAAGKF